MNRGNAKWIVITGIVVSGMTLLAACSNSDPSASRPPVLEPGAASQSAVVTVTPTTQSWGPHWVQDSRLRSLMGIIANQTAAVPGQGADVETPPGFLKNQPFDQAATLAEGLAQTALMIPRVPGKERLSEADRRGFDTLAAMLHAQAQQLKAAAQAHQIERMQGTLSTISNTCSACHTQYRDVSGAFEPRASVDN